MEASGNTRNGAIIRFALAICACIASGCAPWQLDSPPVVTVGQPLVSPQPGVPIATSPPPPSLTLSSPQARPVTIPSKPVPGTRPANAVDSLSVAPQTVVAPVNSEVAMVASANGPNGRMETGRRVEWTLDPAGVGHFVAVDGASMFHPFLRWDSWPRKVDATFAISKTLRQNITLTRGTPIVDDDMMVLSGQTWATVTSPVEGTSYLSAYAPAVYGWDGHKQAARIHWVDAVWSFPPAAVNPAGTRHVFTTTVLRHTDQSPIAGWLVRYEIVDGPPAGFAPDGATAIQVPTDESGQASVEIFQAEPQSGTNNVRIEIIRPAQTAGGAAPRLVVATGATAKTWSSPDIALRMNGPSRGSIGSTLTYRIDVSNPGGVAAAGVSVLNDIPQGLSYLNSTPAATSSGPRLQWDLGELAAGQLRSIEVNLRADQAGTFNNCATANTGEGLTAQNCVSTTVTVPSLDVTINGPPQVRVGDQVVFDITIANRGDVLATDLVLVNRFDPGLQHEIATSPIERDLENLEPGQARRVQIAFTATQPGEQCSVAEVVANGGVATTARACVSVEAAAAPPATAPPATIPNEPPPQTQPPSTPAGPGQVRVRKTGPSSRIVGNMALFSIEVTNTGQVPLTNVKVVDNYDTSLDPQQASDGYEIVGQDLVWTEASLAPGETARFEINCRCTQAIERSCNRVTVTADGGLRADDEFCLEIQSPPAGLTMTLSDLNDPVEAGKQLTYEIRVQNQGQAPDGNIVVEVRLPQEFSPVAIGTSGPTQPSIEGQTIRFAPVAELGAGQTLTYRVRVQANRAGMVRMVASVTSQSLSTAVTAEESTSVFDAAGT